MPEGMAPVQVQVVTGRDLLPWLDALAELRIRIFREFPYLYDGSLAYERQYLQGYARSPLSLIVLALDDDQVVGCSTGLPLVDADPAFRLPFTAAGHDPESVFYFGESVLEAAYRGRGLGHRFFDQREAHAARHGFALTTFCAVERPPDHPRRPESYRPLDAFWRRRGYRRDPDLCASFAWKDIDEISESDKTLTFWRRPG